MLSALRRQLEQHLALPLPVQTKAQPVIETVLGGRSVVEKLFNSFRITRFHNIKPLSAITITVASPTAAEHTKQPASISENSR